MHERLHIGDLAEKMGDLDASLNAFENAIRHNRSSVEAHTRVANIARGREELTKVCTLHFTSHRISKSKAISEHLGYHTLATSGRAAA